MQRQKVIGTLSAAGIPSNIYYKKPLHAQKAFSYLAQGDADFPVAADICGRILSLPMHPYLDGKAAAYICETLKTACN